MEATPSFPLRALSIGEIFDRAVTIYVRYFAVFTAMIFSLLAPFSVLQYLIAPSQGDLAQVFTQAGKTTTQTQMLSGAQLGEFLVLALVLMLLSPFVNNAVAVGVADLYSGRTPNFGAAFAAVFRRWAPLLGTALLAGLMIAAIYGGGALVLGIVLGIGIVLVKPLLPLAIFVFILTGIGLLALILALVVLLLVFAFATYGSTLEQLGAGQAIASAYRRIFAGGELRKATLIALAYIALQFGSLTVSSVVAIVVRLLTKLPVLEIAVSAVASSVLTAFLTILIAVYYYDVRTRAEGLDLEVDLSRLTATP